MGTPSTETVETNAVGRGVTALVRNLYTSLSVVSINENDHELSTAMGVVIDTNTDAGVH